MGENATIVTNRTTLDPGFSSTRTSPILEHTVNMGSDSECEDIYWVADQGMKLEQENPAWYSKHLCAAMVLGDKMAIRS